MGVASAPAELIALPESIMRVGVFTPLLSQPPLDEVLKKLKGHQIDTVELGTGNYPGDAHCKCLGEIEDFNRRSYRRLAARHRGLWEMRSN
jgi:hypothetical protein